MKALICKCFDEEDIESKVPKLVSREGKRFGDKLKVFCADEEIQKRLGEVGVVSEVVPDLQRHAGIDDEASWERVYQLSDELRASVGEHDLLKYSGINFLDLEHNIIRYVYAVKLSRLLGSAAAQDWQAVILVLTRPYVDWLADITSPKIRTIRYGRAVMTGLFSWVIRESHALLMYVKNYVSTYAVRSVTGGSRDRKQPSALFVVSTPLYARPALAIGDECLRNGLNPRFATDDMSLIPLLRTHGFTYRVKLPVLISAVSPAANVIRFLATLLWLRKHVSAFYSASPDEFSAEYLCKETLLAELPAVCYKSLSGIVFMEKSLKKGTTDLICVMPYNAPLQALAAALAKKYNIPTLACSAAWETSDARSFRRHMHADRIAVMGERIRDIYLQSGLEPERVVTTGVAHFDRLFSRDAAEDELTLRGCNIDPDKPFILFTTDGIIFSETEQMLEGVINAVLKTKDFQLVVKVHPREGIERYHALAEKRGNARIVVVKDVDVYALIRGCKLLATKYSTTALEAMIVGKPVITINLSGHPVPVPYAEEGAALGVYNYADIEPAIQKVLYNEEIGARLKAGRDRFVRAWAGEPDGKASLRIVRLMRKMITESQAEEEKIETG